MNLNDSLLPVLTRNLDASPLQIPLRLNGMLAPFTGNAVRFMRYLDAVHGVLSGSFALKWLTGGDWTVGDLDVYVPHGKVEAIVQRLQDVEGYAFGTEWEAEPYAYNFSGVVRVVTLYRNDRKLQVMESATSSATYPLTHFWTTMLMNFLTSTTFTCAYPALTLRSMGVINPRVLDDGGIPLPHVLPLLRKYEDRGFRFFTRPEEASLVAGNGASAFLRHAIDLTNLFHRVRSFDDKYSLTIYHRAHGGGQTRIAIRPAAPLGRWRSAWVMGGIVGHYTVQPLAYTFDALTGLQCTIHGSCFVLQDVDPDTAPEIRVRGNNTPVEIVGVGRDGQDLHVRIVLHL